MKLFHGSYLDIERIDLSKSMKGKDFGQGFYLSSDYQQAENIAKIRSLALMKIPIINIYEFDEEILNNSILKIRQFNAYSKEWAEFILANRNNLTDNPIHDYDIVIGPIANDRVGKQIRRFTEGEITMDEFLERLKYMKGLTIQYYFGTPESLKHLKKLEAIEIH